MKYLLLLIATFAGLMCQELSDWSKDRLDNYQTMCDLVKKLRPQDAIPQDKTIGDISSEYCEYLLSRPELIKVLAPNKYDKSINDYSPKSRGEIILDIRREIIALLKIDKRAIELHKKLLVPILKYRKLIQTSLMKNTEYNEAVQTANRHGWDIFPNYSSIFLDFEDQSILEFYYSKH